MTCGMQTRLLPLFSFSSNPSHFCLLPKHSSWTSFSPSEHGWLIKHPFLPLTTDCSFGILRPVSQASLLGSPVWGVDIKTGITSKQRRRIKVLLDQLMCKLLIGAHLEEQKWFSDVWKIHSLAYCFPWNASLTSSRCSDVPRGSKVDPHE